MAELRVLSRKEAFEFISRIGGMALAGQPMPEITEDLQMKAEDMADGIHAFTRRIAERFDQIPEQIADDVVGQEIVRAHIDSVMKDLVLVLEESISILTR